MRILVAAFVVVLVGEVEEVVVAGGEGVWTGVDFGVGGV